MAGLDCLVIGAGLSGLACAQTLESRGLQVSVIESQDQVGGRVRTRTLGDGFVGDEGFQVLLSSYPELTRFLNLDALNLKRFNSGAKIYQCDGFDLLANPLVHPGRLFDGFKYPGLSAKDKFLVLKLIAVSQKHSSDSPMGIKTTRQFLTDFGFSQKFIESFWEPFLSGIYLERDLQAGENYFQFLIRCFCFGKVSIPEKGMGEIPKQMASRLSAGAIRPGERVKSWSHDHVTLQSGDTVFAKKVVCAMDPSDWNIGFEQTKYQSVGTHYFTSDSLSELALGKWLALIPRKYGFKINHFCLLSEVSSAYSSSGKPLLCVNTLGTVKSSTVDLCNELDRLFGRKLNLRHIQSIEVEKALPRASDAAAGYIIKDGVYYCGDRWTSPSINGALRSGRLAAESILREISV